MALASAEEWASDSSATATEEDLEEEGLGREEGSESTEAVRLATEGWLEEGGFEEVGPSRKEREDEMAF